MRTVTFSFLFFLLCAAPSLAYADFNTPGITMSMDDISQAIADANEADPGPVGLDDAGNPTNGTTANTAGQPPGEDADTGGNGATGNGPGVGQGPSEGGDGESGDA